MLSLKKGRRFLASTLAVLTTTLIVNPVFAAGSNSTPTPEAQAAEIVSKMSLEEKAGQMLMPDFRNWNGSAFTVMNDEVKGVIQKYHLGGVILFAENVQGTEQTARLTDGLQKASTQIPLLLSIDQEGGSIVRLQTGTNMPGNMPLGATRDADLAYRTGKAIGEELYALGINTNFAPDMDVNLNPDNPVIGIRSFGGNADMVAQMGVAYAKGVQDAGDIATVKHFPGHGDVATDSHTGLPLVPYDMTRLKNVELKPFQAAMDNGIDMIMSAHIQFPAVDDTKVISKKDGAEIYLPATLSKKVMTDLVRTQMGYKGVIVTDALNMQAISDNFGKEDAVIRAINAGVDIALMPTVVQSTTQIANLDSVFNAVVNAVNTGVIPQSRINESATRVIALKIRRGIYNPAGNTDTRTIDEKIANANAVVGSSTHRAIETEGVNKAVTLIRNDNKILPFKLSNNAKVVVITPFPDRNNLLETGVMEAAAASNVQGVTVTKYTYSTSTVPTNVKNAMLAADYVIFGSYVYNVASRKTGSFYADYALDINNIASTNNIKMVDVSICYPYEPMYLNNAKTLINVYGRYATAPNPSLNLLGATRAIFGLINPTGKLPVDVPNPNDTTKNIYDFGYGLVYDQTAKQAEDLVAKAEASLGQNDIDTANAFLSTLPNYPGKSELISRIQRVETNLSGINVGGAALQGFAPDKTEYNVILPAGTTSAPQVSVSPVYNKSKTAVTQASALPGTAIITITAEDGITAKNYTINFTVAKIATAALSIDKNTIDRTKTEQLHVSGKLDNGEDADLSKATIKYVSSNDNIVSVDDNGVIKANKLGSAELTAIVTLNGTAVQSNSVTVNVNDLKMDPVQISLDYEKPIVEVNEETTITLNAKAAKNLYGFDMSFKYDKDLFDLVSVTPKDEFNWGPDGVVQDGNGKVRVVGILRGKSEGISGDIALVTVKLKAKNKTEAGSLTILNGSQFSDKDTALYTLDKDVSQNIAVANSDFDLNGQIIINDLVAVARAFGLGSKDDHYSKALDMNKDGIIDITDLAYVAKKVLGN